MNYLKSMDHLAAAVASLRLRGAVPDAVRTAPDAMPTLDMGGMGEDPPPPPDPSRHDSKARGGVHRKSKSTPPLIYRPTNQSHRI